jgi:hypothetical protein
MTLRSCPVSVLLHQTRFPGRGMLSVPARVVSVDLPVRSCQVDCVKAPAMDAGT